MSTQSIEKFVVPIRALTGLFLLVAVGLGLIVLSAHLPGHGVSRGHTTLTKTGTSATRSGSGNIKPQVFADAALSFEPNLGQTDPSVKYMAKGSQYTLFLTSTEAVFAFPKLHMPRLDSQSKASIVSSLMKSRLLPDAQAPDPTVRMQLVGAVAPSRAVPGNKLQGKKNYFIGRDPSKWTKGVPLFSQVEYCEVYKGIDVVYRGLGKQSEFDFLLNPGASPGDIALAFKGVRGIEIQQNGDLVLSANSGELRLGKPAAYQEEDNGRRLPVDVWFVEGPNESIRFSVGRYDHARKLVIDPSVTFATYLGGSNQDEGLGVATDGQGNTFVTGATNSPDFPVTIGGYNAGFDVFVTEYDPSGNLLNSTLIGGSMDDIGTSIAVDSNFGLVYITGSTNSPDFPAPGGAQTFLAGVQNAFVLELNALDLSFNTATYLGGEAVDAGFGIAGDGGGYIYVVGQTTSAFFPNMLPLPNESQINLGHGTGPSDGFVTRVAPGCTSFVFSTYLGGSQQDFASGIAIDKPNDPNSDFTLYVTGGTVSPDFFTTPGVIQPTCGTDGNCNGGKDDAFVTAICFFTSAPCNGDGITPIYFYSTFLGGSGVDVASAIAADVYSNSYITGHTNSTDFKLQGAFQGSLKGTQNAFVSKLSSGGTALVYSSYLGGSSTDAGLGIAIDLNGNAYLTGSTNSSDFPLVTPTQGTIGGGYDAFISELNSSGSALTFSTYLGGSGDEDQLGGSIAADDSQSVYVTGDTNSSNFPITEGSYVQKGNCNITGHQVPCPYAFVAKVNAQPANNSTLTIVVTGNTPSYVTSMPPGIDCGQQDPNHPNCSASFTNGTQITLTPNPVSSFFNGWIGGGCDSQGTGPCVLTLNSNTIITANFTLSQQNATVTVGVNGNGSGTVISNPPGIDCGLICSADFPIGTNLKLTATPNSDSYFVGWSGGGCTGNVPTCTITVGNNPPTITATFNLINGPPPPKPDFSLTATAAAPNPVNIGSTAVSGLNMVALNGFADTVTLSCSVQPASSSAPGCTLTPAAVDIPLGGAATTTLTIATSGLTASLPSGPRRHQSRPLYGFFVSSLAFGLLGRPGMSSISRRRKLFVAITVLALAGIAAQLGCSTGHGSGGSSGGVAQPGNYKIVVTAAAASTPGAVHSVQVPITVQ